MSLSKQLLEEIQEKKVRPYDCECTECNSNRWDDWYGEPEWQEQ